MDDISAIFSVEKVQCNSVLSVIILRDRGRGMQWPPYLLASGSNRDIAQHKKQAKALSLSQLRR
jgi:hypothetical protein